MRHARCACPSISGRLGDIVGALQRHDGVLTVRIPVAEQAKPRKVEVGQRRPAAPEAIETSAATVSSSQP